MIDSIDQVYLIDGISNDILLLNFFCLGVLRNFIYHHLSIAHYLIKCTVHRPVEKKCGNIKLNYNI